MTLTAIANLSDASDVAASLESHRESDADYHSVVCHLNDRWRVIECRDGIQWIIQQRVGERHGGARFNSRSYLRTREALIRLCHGLTGEIEPSAMAILESLPRMIGMGGDT